MTAPFEWRRLSDAQRRMLFLLASRNGDGEFFGGAREKTALALVRHGLARESERVVAATLFKITPEGLALIDRQARRASAPPPVAKGHLPTLPQRAALVAMRAAPEQALERQAGGFWTRLGETQRQRVNGYGWGVRDVDYFTASTVSALQRRGLVVDTGGRVYATRVTLTVPGEHAADMAAEAAR